jgi:RHS repeat-associated protein
VICRFTHDGETVTAAYLLYDGHGDVVSVRNETLDEIANYEYDIYGEEKTSTGVYDSPIRYTGQYYDAETGMYYLRARYYDPSIRRFISEDPAHDGRNWYAYCNGNPIKYWDPSGLVAQLVGSLEDQMFLLSLFQMLTDDFLTIQDDIIVINSSASQIKKKYGTALVRNIINNKWTTRVQISRDPKVKSKTVGSNIENLTNGIGESVDVFLYSPQATENTPLYYCKISIWFGR